MLEGKIAWITGAGTGIGLAGAKALSESGATVIMSGRRKDILEKEASIILETGGKVEIEPLDVMDSTSVLQVADSIIKRHGRVDILVNNAGTNTENRFWKNQTIEGWDQVIGVNLDGVFYCTKAVLDVMRQQKDGLIINVASWAGVHNVSITGPGYNGSKHAVVSITETLNMEECKNGIRACALCPGEVDTPIMDSRPVPPPKADREKMLSSEDLGNTIRWIAEQPPHVCLNEIVISPTWNRLYVGSIESNR